MSNNRLELDTDRGGVLIRDQGHYFYKCPKCKLKGRPNLHFRGVTYNNSDDQMEVRCTTCDFEEWVSVNDL